MRVKLLQTGAHAPWQVDEIVTVQVVAVDDDAGAYECETLETYPPDIKEKHAAAIADLQEGHAAEVARIRDEHAVALAGERLRHGQVEGVTEGVAN